MAEVPRTSVRGNKGVAPKRLGFEDVPMRLSGPQSVVGHASSGVSSHASGSGRSSVLEAKRAMLEAKRNLAAAEAEIASLAYESASKSAAGRKTPRSSSPRMMNEVFEDEKLLEQESATVEVSVPQAPVMALVPEPVQEGLNLIDLHVDSVHALASLTPASASEPGTCAQPHVDQEVECAESHSGSDRVGPDQAQGREHTEESETFENRRMSARDSLVMWSQDSEHESPSHARSIDSMHVQRRLQQVATESHASQRKELALRSELQRTRHELELQRSTAQAEIRELRENLDKLRRISEQRKQEFEALACDRQQARGELLKLQQQAKHAESDREHVQLQAEALRAALDDSQAESRDLFETLSSTQDELRRAIRDGAEAQSLLRVERDQLQQCQLQLRDAASRAQREVDDWRYLFLKECEVTTEGTPNCSKDAVTSCGTGRVTKGWTSNAASASRDSHEQLPRSDLPPRYKPNAEQKQVISAQGGANGYALSAPVLDDDTPRPQQQQREVPVSSPLVGIAQEFVGALTQALQGSGAPNHAAQFTQLAARQSTVNTELPAFSGKPAEWPAFISIYRSTTEQCGFTDAENAQRLTKSLSGAAKDAVRLMLAVPGNVGEAIAALERRFGRPEQVISDLIGKAKGARPLRADDAESLIAFTTSVTNIVMTMKLLDSRGHMTNPSLRAELVDKLPAGLRTQWGEHLMARGLQSDSLSLEVFASWLSERADTAALVTTTTRSATITSKSHPSTLLATSQGASQSGFRKQQRSGPQCQKCNGSHPVTSCAEFKALTIKRRWDMVYATGLCAVCLKAGHWKATCKATSCRKCSGKHHELLHTDRTDHQSQQARPGTTSGNKPKETSLVLKANNGAAHTVQVVRSSTVLFMTLPVVLEYAGRQTTARALLDSGSSLSFVRQDVAAELEMKGTEDEGFAVSVLGGKTLQGPQQQVHATLRSTDGAFQCELHPWTQEDITAPLPAIDYDELQQQYPHLQDIPLETQNSERIDVLLGLDAIAAHQVLQEVVGQPGEPIGRRLPLGWVCLGPTGHPPEQRVEVTAHATPAERLDDLVERFWETEQIGLVPSQTVADQEAELLVDKTMKHQDGRVWTRLPWASGSEPDLPDNREMAEKRLYSLERTLSKRPEVQRQYAEVIDSYLTKGYIRRLGDQEQRQRQFLLPHFPVVRSDKETTKVRVVFDAAAKHGGKSLNDELNAGPKLQRDLVDVLLAFCLEPVAIVGDVAEMFLQVALGPQDCRYVRFLWRRQPDGPIETFEFTRLVFGLKSSPYLACRALKTVLKESGVAYSERAQHAVDKAFYVDDLLDSLPTAEEAIAVRHEVQNMLEEGSFHMRKWRSNSKEVLESIPDGDRAQNALLSISDENPHTAAQVKTLGVVWDARTDTFSYEYKREEGARWTKRRVLSKMASIYDPRGHIAPFTVRARLMFQELCVSGIDWDEGLPSDQEMKWLVWFGELEALSRVRIPRCLKDTRRPSRDATLTVHTFTDASADATAAVCYV